MSNDNLIVIVDYFRQDKLQAASSYDLVSDYGGRAKLAHWSAITS